MSLLEAVVLCILGLLILAPFLCWRRAPLNEEVVTLWAYQVPLQRPLFQKAAEEFERQHPGVKVKFEEPSTWELEKMLVAMQAGAFSDVVYIHFSNIPVLAAKNAFIPLDEFCKRDNLDFHDFFPTGFEAYTHNGNLLAIPFSGSTTLMFYNKNLFDAANIAYPSDDWTWDDLLEAAKKLTLVDNLGRLTQIGIQPYQFFTWIWSGGGEVANDALSEFYFTSSETMGALQFYADLKNRWKVTSGSEGLSDGTPSAMDLFESGKVAMNIDGPWTLANRIPIKHFDWDVALVPKGPGGRQTAYAGIGFAIWSGTKKKELAWKLVKFMSGKEGQAIFCKGFNDIPARRSVTLDFFAKQKAPFNMDIVLKSMDPEYGRLRLYPKHEKWPYIREFLFEKEYHEVLLEEKTLEKGMRAAEEQVEQYMTRQSVAVSWKHYFGIAGLFAFVVGISIWRFKIQQQAGSISA